MKKLQKFFLIPTGFSLLAACSKLEEYNTQETAIDAAGPKASIYIEPGEYHESIWLSRSDIFLISAGL